MNNGPLLYCPGIDGTGRLLFRQSRLFERYAVRCLAYPQDRSHTYTDLVALARAELERAGESIVLAESFGGAVALRLALECPELVSRLVLVNTFAHFPRRPLIEVLAFLGRYFPGRPAHPLTRPLRGPIFFAPDVPRAERLRWWELTADVPLSALGRRLELIGGLDLLPRLGEIRAPTLVLAAPNDRVVPPSAGQTLARQLPAAKLIRPRAGHAAMVHPSIDIAALLEDTRFWQPSQFRREL